MKKPVSKIPTLALALLSFGAFAQEKIQPCNTYAAMEQGFENNPEMRKRYEAAQAQLQAATNNVAQRSAAAPIYTIPVVFHVLYECNGVNITDAAIIQALAEINNDYARKSPDTNLVVNPFKTSYIDSEIQFMLAKKDPQGNCINGIVRHQDAKTKWYQSIANQSNIAGNNYWSYTWDPTKYLNVYLVAEIVPQGTVTGGGTIVGYTFRPGSYPNNPHDAIVYNMSYMSGTNAGVPKSRSLSHEMGHWLNLAHTFGNTNNPGVTCADDGISDTPITRGEFGGCPTSFSNACTQTNPALAGLNNVQNIMNYSDCPRNFTTGQTNAMRTALASSVNGRNNLSTNSNLIFTGVNNSGLCSPVAEFFPTNCSYTICAGASLSMKDYSYNGSVTSMTWTADNGAVIATPNASITSISFPNGGTTNITLQVANAQGTDSKTKQVTVVGGLIGTPVIMESFEQPGILPPDWEVINPDNDNVTWTQTPNAAYDGAHSYMIAGASNPANNSDILQTPSMDVLNNPGNVFEFAYAYRQQNASQNDVLRIEGSKDCGGTWQTIYTMNAATMSNGSGGVGTDDFTPSTNEWKVYKISSHPQWQNFKTSANVLVRFNFIEGTSGYGNNIYVDAINFYGTTGLNELTSKIRFNMYPNPTTGETNISINLNDPAKVNVSVVDIMGREVLPAMENNYNAGEHIIAINKNSTLAPGVYFVNLLHNGAKISSKLVIE